MSLLYDHLNRMKLLKSPNLTMVLLDTMEASAKLCGAVACAGSSCATCSRSMNLVKRPRWNLFSTHKYRCKWAKFQFDFMNHKLWIQRWTDRDVILIEDFDSSLDPLYTQQQNRNLPKLKKKFLSAKTAPGLGLAVVICWESKLGEAKKSEYIFWAVVYSGRSYNIL